VSRRAWIAFAVLALVWLAATLSVLSARWFLSCTVDGQPLGGIDCFQANTLPATDSAPASWIGFVPLVLLWVASGGAIVWLIVHQKLQHVAEKPRRHVLGIGQMLDRKAVRQRDDDRG
jgi:hypothetical protein